MGQAEARRVSRYRSQMKQTTELRVDNETHYDVLNKLRGKLDKTHLVIEASPQAPFETPQLELKQPSSRETEQATNHMTDNEASPALKYS